MRVGWVIYGIIVAGVIIACQKNNPTKSLPAITQSGKHTLGFFANGKCWLPNDKGNHEKYQLPKASLTKQGKLKISATSIDEENFSRQWFCLEVSEGCLKEGRYNLTNESCRAPLQTFYYGSNRNLPAEQYEIDTTAEHFIDISYLSLEQKIISGTFQFDAVSDQKDTLRIRSGRFDLQLK